LAPLRTEWRKFAASTGENNPNWVVFPGKMSGEALNRRPLGAAPDERARVPDVGIKTFFKNLNFLLAIFGPIVHSHKKLTGRAPRRLVRCP
jgi:hypothetical protein